MENQSKHPQKKLGSIIILSFFLVFFFSYFYFFITDNAMSGKVISNEKQITFNISSIDFIKQGFSELDVKKIANFFIILGTIFIFIIILSIASRYLHRRVSSEDKRANSYSAFKSSN